MEVKLKRGQKLCRNCNTINGVRSFNCKSCNSPFAMKKVRKTILVDGKVKRNFITDHKTLQKGDYIRVFKKGGPYHLDKDGNKNYLCHKGKYTVDRIMEDGIMVHSQYGGSEFLYMGPKMISPILDTLIRAPHKITLITKGVRDV
jgi:hypothetical protein